MKAVGKNDILTREQKDIMNRADVGTAISVKARYIPENNLKHNDIKEINFTFTPAPENDATYVGGEEELRKYLKEKAIDKIPDGIFVNWALAAVKFAVNEDGEIIDVHIFESSKDEKTDGILLEAIRNMPCWKPAEYTNGRKVKQEFVLTVGNMENCVVHTLHIRRN